MFSSTSCKGCLGTFGGMYLLSQKTCWNKPEKSDKIMIKSAGSPCEGKLYQARYAQNFRTSVSPLLRAQNHCFRHMQSKGHKNNTTSALDVTVEHRMKIDQAGCKFCCPGQKLENLNRQSNEKLWDTSKTGQSVCIWGTMGAFATLDRTAIFFVWTVLHTMLTRWRTLPFSKHEISYTLGQLPLDHFHLVSENMTCICRATI